MNRFLLIFFLIILSITAFSVPYSYIDEPSGWFEIIVSYHYIFGPQPSLWSIGFCAIGEDLTWIDNSDLGFGFTFAWGVDTLLFTINSTYFLDVLNSETIAVPVTLRAGINVFSDSFFYATLTTGLELFTGQWKGFHEYDLEEQVCINLGLMGGLYFADLQFHPAIEGMVGLSTANAYSPSSGVYYY